MRAIILVLIIAVIALIVAIGTGLLNISQTREAKAPQISASGAGVTASGGQPPKFDVETGAVKVGSTEKSVKVPVLKVERPAANQAEAASNAQ